MSARKKWRRLYAEPPVAWQALRATDRGIGCELLRRLDDTLRIPLHGRPPHVAVCQLLAAHPEERRAVKGSVERMLAAGVLVLEADALVAHIPDPAMEAADKGGGRSDDNRTTLPRRSGGTPATLSRRSRDASTTLPKHSHDTPATLPRQCDGDNASESLENGSTPIKRRGEEKRGEHIARAQEPPTLPGTEVTAEDVHSAFVSGWRERYAKLKPPRRSNLFDPLWQELAVGLQDHAQLEALMAAFWADEFCGRTGHKPGALASERARLLAEHGPRPRDDWDRLLEALEAARAAGDLDRVEELEQARLRGPRDPALAKVLARPRGAARAAGGAS